MAPGVPYSWRSFRLNVSAASLNSAFSMIRVHLDMYAPKAHSLVVLTIVESPLFQKLWPLYWTEEERGEFAAYLAIDPTAGVVIRESGGLRKVRWARPGSGKSGGVRIIDRKSVV